MTLRPAHLALGSLGFLGLLFCASLIHAFLSSSSIAARAEEGRQLVRQLGLSDLTLFTEARYTRHPSMADLHTPFQDHPGSLDHFPSGSLILPPKTLAQQGQIDRGRETP
ncbi:hypothetical protein [uncultured Cohaesibacter sp.]|uniref:hypothetical protein n=1 Tax=uncultured Cohaesibacter sp. TaxID=1002546 RepID=UPI0029C838D4|nr:hypothetical protein [uncultured Cohaesibacter sp.]